MTKPLTVRDRIVELRRIPARTLVPNVKNWRKHPKAQQEALEGVLREIGYVDALLVREDEDGRLHLIDGHLRAGVTPDQDVPVLVLDVDEHEADLILATFDPLAAMAEADRVALDELLREVDTGEAAVQAMLAALAEQSGVVPAAVLPSGESQPEPVLKGECLIEVYCSTSALDTFRPTLDEWGKRKDVTVNIS